MPPFVLYPIFAISIIRPSFRYVLHCFRNPNCSFINISLFVIVLWRCLNISLSRILPKPCLLRHEFARQTYCFEHCLFFDVLWWTYVSKWLEYGKKTAKRAAKQHQILLRSCHTIANLFNYDQSGHSSCGCHFETEVIVKTRFPWSCAIPICDRSVP